jgi:hypothetical protein
VIISTHAVESHWLHVVWYMYFLSSVGPGQHAQQTSADQDEFFDALLIREPGGVFIKVRRM